MVQILNLCYSLEMIKAIIFDCFGVVLTDALDTMVAALRASDPESFRRIADAIGKASIGLIDREETAIVISAELGITPDEYTQRIKDGEVRNTELLEYITTLRKKYKTAMLSNISKGGLEARFDPGELEQYFDVIVPSSAIGYAKPEAIAYEVTADRLGVRFNECVMIDDREAYVEGAVGVGMQAIHYQSFEQMKAELEALLKQA